MIKLFEETKRHYLGLTEAIETEIKKPSIDKTYLAEKIRKLSVILEEQ